MIVKALSSLSFSAGSPSVALVLALVLLLGAVVVREPARAQIDPGLMGKARDSLIARHGTRETERIDRGLAQVARAWRAEDGDAAAFQTFVEAEFLPSGEALDRTFDRFEFALERLDGYMISLIRDLRRGADLEIGPMLPLDHRLAAYSPNAHTAEDFFANKIAFVGLLNFPLSTLEERLADGLGWERRRWAETRLAERFSDRVPAEVNQAYGAATAAADSYINAYNIHMHHLLTEDGERLFPEGLRLISHWGLRDELKANYSAPDGLAKQRMIQKVFDRIVRQEIPAAVIDNPKVDWTPATNAVVPAPGNQDDAGRLAARENDERYRHWLEVFRAARKADPHYPEEPTFIDRRFNRDREVPENEVEALFVSVLDAKIAHEVARMVEWRLGRRLEAFDIWYNGFKPGSGRSEADLDQLTRERYPSAEAFSKDIPRLLQGLGFAEAESRFLSSRVVVEPSRGAGHAFGGARRDDNAHLRTRVGEAGMDYKGYNIAVHELGHNIEQIYSVSTIDHTLLQGVPNTAFTEALAFVFQDRDLELLGIAQDDAQAEHLQALDTFWNTREIAGVALVDMRVWRWLYEHPEATPAEMREAVLGIAKGVWNRYFAGVFGGLKDQTLLAVYSHMVDAAMYTPDYPLGHLIAFQIEEHFRNLKGSFGEEFKRICQLGSITPDAWMRLAVGSPLSAQPLVEAADHAVDALADAPVTSR